MCTSPVFAYSVVPLKSLGGCCEGAHKKVLRKTVTLLRIARSTHSYRMVYHGRVERGCKLLRGIWGIETCIYKTAGKSSSSSCSFRAASLEKLTGSFHCGNYTLECSSWRVSVFKEILRILFTCGTTVLLQASQAMCNKPHGCHGLNNLLPSSLSVSFTATALVYVCMCGARSRTDASTFFSSYRMSQQRQK